MDTRGRSLAKALSWRLLGAVVTTSLAWVVTGQIRFAALIGTADAVVKFAAYYVHERAWNRLALEVAGRLENEGRLVIVILPDTGER